MPRKPPRTNTGPVEAFVVAWQSSTGIPEVCEKLGIAYTPLSMAACSTRATTLRKAGVPMKAMPTGGLRQRAYNIPLLTALATENLA